MQPITLQPHASIDELEMHYRRAKAPTQRSQLQILWLVALGKSTEEVARITGYNANWVEQLIHQHNQLGSEGFTNTKQSKPVVFLKKFLVQAKAFSTINKNVLQEEVFLQNWLLTPPI